jgi:glycosyltransferase involved in cell wall biosynthesis
LPQKYALKVCRIEPENNIHLILKAFSDSKLPLVVIGNWNHSKYGVVLKKKYAASKNLFLLDSIYDQNILNQIRSNCTIYIHGHSAGGTNPSLVEAMALGLPILSYDVVYNRETTFNRAKYFKSKEDLKKVIQEIKPEELSEIGNEMQKLAQKEYTWKKFQINTWNFY